MTKQATFLSGLVLKLSATNQSMMLNILEVDKKTQVKERQTPSSNIFEALKSLYMTFFSEVCRKARPRAAPITILSRMPQESGSMLGFPAQPKKLLQFFKLLKLTQLIQAQAIQFSHTSKQMILQASLRQELIDKEQLFILPTVS